MKRLLLLCLLVAGCSENKPKVYDPPGAVPMVQFRERDLGVPGSLWFCTNDNHRFAIAVTSYHYISICEVTDASLVDRRQAYAEDWKPDTNGLTIAWKDGWMAYAIDYAAVSQFHRDALNVTNSADEFAMWQKCIENASRMESNWNALTKDQKLAYPISPFWKQSRGTPRRIP